MATKHSNRKLSRNPDSLQAVNPLIGSSPGDTWNNVDAVLSLLQDHVGAVEDLDEQVNWGAFMVLHTVRDALKKQAAELSSEGGGSNG